ncbi:MAG: hypothetical protein ACPG6P_05935 [Akkermansiaceae bacterium]
MLSQSMKCYYLWLLAAVISSCAPHHSASRLAFPTPQKESKEDLLHQARYWVTTEGRAAARDRLAEAIEKQDSSGGGFEQRVITANGDKTKVFANSLATLSPDERKKIGVYFVLGYNQNRGKSPPIIMKTAEHVRQLGYRAKYIDMAPRQTAQQDAERIAQVLREDLPKVDRAILVGFSKGSTDLVHFWLDQAHQLPKAELKKIKLWVNFAGGLRGSAIARWGAVGNDPMAWGFRCFLNWREGEPSLKQDDLVSIGHDQWAKTGAKLPKGVRGQLTVINYVSLPDGKDGWATMDQHVNLLGRSAVKEFPHIGPCDGLMETASSILPPNTGLRQWVVRVYGSHSLPGGKYPNGKYVASKYHQGGRARLQSGAQLMDDFLRAAPKSLVLD